MMPVKTELDNWLRLLHGCRRYRRTDNMENKELSELKKKAREAIDIFNEVGAEAVRDGTAGVDCPIDGCRKEVPEQKTSHEDSHLSRNSNGGRV